MNGEEFYGALGTYMRAVKEKIDTELSKLINDAGSLSEEERDIGNDKVPVLRAGLDLVTRVGAMEWRVVSLQDAIDTARKETGGNLFRLVSEQRIVPDIDENEMKKIFPQYRDMASVAVAGSLEVLRAQVAAALDTQTGQAQTPFTQGVREAFTFMRQAAGIDAEVVTLEQMRAIRRARKNEPGPKPF